MRIVPQLLLIAALAAVAVPVAARFVPGSRPMLDRIGLLAPMQSLGLAPVAEAVAEAAAGDGAAGQGGGGQGGGGGGALVVAAEPQLTALRDVVTSIGSARGAASVVLSPGVSGRVLALRAGAGDRVAAGAVILELDAEAAQLAVDRAQLVLDDATATIERLERLAGAGTATAIQLQDARLAQRTADLALRAAKRDLADHSLTAPVAGVVGLIEVQPGDLVTSATEVTRIEDRSTLVIDFRVPERVAALVKPGDPVSASPISDPGLTIHGQIIAVDNRVDEASRTLRLQARIGNDADTFRTGMAFRMALEFTGADYPAVDPLAIQWGSEGAFVWVARGGKALRLPIRILQRNAASVLVEVALEPGDLVVTEGVQALRPGAEVQLAPGQRS
ncbi:MAG: efflux RND transporter periplasmic adaptor subunit [Paracoccaceae bacterium]